MHQITLLKLSPGHPAPSTDANEVIHHRLAHREAIEGHGDYYRPEEDVEPIRSDHSALAEPLVNANPLRNLAAVKAHTRRRETGGTIDISVAGTSYRVPETLEQRGQLSQTSSGGR